MGPMGEPSWSVVVGVLGGFGAVVVFFVLIGVLRSIRVRGD